MTDKEFKRLGRAQLVEVIYQLQLKVNELTEQNQALRKALADKRLRIDSAGNIAEAALEINNCFQSAQAAAEQYINEIRLIHAETDAECARILEEARAEAAAIVAQGSKKQGDYDSAIDAILKEYGQHPGNNR